MLPTTIRVFPLLLALSAAAAAQTVTVPATAAPARKRPRVKPYQPPYNPNVIVLDPAHGGDDNGANLGKAGFEKDYDFAFAERLRDLLTAQGFTVVLTHQAADDNVSADQRVELANRSRGVACLLLHATAAGQGVHLFTSALTAPSTADDSRSDSFIALWDSAQASSLPRSQQLANELSTSLNGMKIPLLTSSVSVSPIDSMFCPAVAVEIAAPRARGNLADEAYQEHIAESLVTALNYWRQRAKDQIAAAEAAAAMAAPGAAAPTPLPKPKAKPRPVMIHSPDEMPLAPDSLPAKPAPVEQKAPARATTGAPPAGVQP